MREKHAKAVNGYLQERPRPCLMPVTCKSEVWGLLTWEACCLNSNAEDVKWLPAGKATPMPHACNLQVRGLGPVDMGSMLCEQHAKGVKGLPAGKTKPASQACSLQAGTCIVSQTLEQQLQEQIQSEARQAAEAAQQQRTASNKAASTSQPASEQSKADGNKQGQSVWGCYVFFQSARCCLVVVHVVTHSHIRHT